MIRQQTQDFSLGFRWKDKILSGATHDGVKVTYWAGYRGNGRYQAEGKTRAEAIAKVRKLLKDDSQKVVERMLADNGVDLTHRVMEWNSKT